jgi:uncharacterized protein (TIGR02444 family)
MSLWEWALGAYGRDGVADACLHLQDAHGQNVPLLLWAAWAELDDPGRLAQGAAAARSWDAVAVTPLRAIRRSLKAPAPPVADAAREAVREEVKAIELRAERVLLETLAGVAGAASGGAPAFDALKAASKAWGPPAPDDTLAALARALS